MPGEDSSTAQYSFRAAKLDSRELLVVSVEGVEAISRLYHYRLLLASRNAEFKSDDLVGQMSVLQIFMNKNEQGGGVPDAPEVARYVSGIISRFEHVNDGTSFSQYEAEIVPFVWLLNFRQKSRIFQKQDVKEIIAKVLKDAGVTDKMYRFATTATYPKRDYCVQYRESEWDFLQRLMEEEGIFYFFEHSELGHVIVFGDAPAANPSIVGNAKVPYRSVSQMVSTEHIQHFRLGKEIRPDRVTLKDYEFTKPVPALEGKKELSPNLELEHYEYPSQYIADAGGKDKKEATLTTSLAQIRLAEFQATRVLAEAKGICRRLIAGSTFELTDFSRAATNQVYLITDMRIEGFQPESLGEDYIGPGEKPLPNYYSEFHCIPYSVPYRPPRLTRKPTVTGSQTAIVTGPSSEEIYTDEHGRVKVRFHWDREGVFDENSSCWVRVSQGWAGGQYGSIFLPRCGQEVIVDFIEGDPDQPIVTGRVFNGDHKPPYPLPDKKTVSTIRTNSSIGGGGANEFRFEDKKGSEQIFLHAEKDLHVRAKNDRVTNIGNNDHLTVEKERRENIKGNHSVTVGGEEAIEVTKKRSVVVKEDVLEDFQANQKVQVGTDFHLKAASNVVIEAGSQLTIKVGGNFVNINSGGVYIKGSKVYINSGGSAGSYSAPSPSTPAAPIEADTETPGADVDYTGQKEPVKPIPVPVLPKKSWIKIELKDDKGEPVSGEPYKVKTSDGKIIEGTLDVNGEANIGGIEPGTCQINFPQLDADEWKRG